MSAGPEKHKRRHETDLRVSASLYDPLKGTRIVIRNATDMNECSKSLSLLRRGGQSRGAGVTASF